MSINKQLLQDLEKLLYKCDEDGLYPVIEIEQLLMSYIQKEFYTDVFELLSYLLFNNSTSEKRLDYISENNMHLYQMLEIYMLEQGNPTVEESLFERVSTIEQFHAVYHQLRIYIRRIWFMYPGNDWKEELKEYLDNKQITAEMLAVVTKYAVEKDMLLYIMDQLSEYLPEQKAMFFSCYRNGIEGEEYAYHEPVGFLQNAEFTPIPEIELDAQLEYETDNKTVDSNKIAVILCKNNDFYVSEIKQYMSCMEIPTGFSIEFITVKNAHSMASGYNLAMKYSNAKYKFYIHQDTFFICPDIFNLFMKAFSSDEAYGLIGIVGCTELPEHGKWWDTHYSTKRMAVYQDDIMMMLRSKSVSWNGFLEPAEALDGILLATSQDILWREDLFDGWHFYDISQCYEFRNAGFKTGVLNPDAMLVLHETTMKKDPEELYEHYRKIFVDHYFKENYL